MAGKQLDSDQALEILVAQSRKNAVMRLAITGAACVALLTIAAKACTVAVCP